MPKIGQTAQAPQKSCTPNRRLSVTAGYDSGWDLREIPSSFLVAELVRRGEVPTSLRPKPAAK